MNNNETIPCWLCQKSLAIQLSKKDKPYLICEGCGLQVFVRYKAGIERLHQLNKKTAMFLDKFVVCTKCDVAIKKSLRNIQNPLFSEAGLYCPSCEELLLKAPPNWKEKRKG